MSPSQTATRTAPTDERQAEGSLSGPALHVVMYHYVRDLPNTSFPKIKGLLTNEFRRQLGVLQNRYEMATLESTLDFLRGTYRPAKDLILLTFDDGLKEHYTEVAPMLADQRIQGLFFVITSCLEEACVASVHMNHFLMAALDFEDYQQSFMRRLRDIDPQAEVSAKIDPVSARRAYRWDTPEVASFKYLFNFVLDSTTRDQVVQSLFEQHIGDEKSFARMLYLSWREASQMQSAGMLIGGHSHRHKPLAALSEEDLDRDLTTCRRLLTEHLLPQRFWPFCYPYGQKESFNDATIATLNQLGFACSFSTEAGTNFPDTHPFVLRRIDCKEVDTIITANGSARR